MFLILLCDLIKIVISRVFCVLHAARSYGRRRGKASECLVFLGVFDGYNGRYNVIILCGLASVFVRFPV